MFMKNEPSLLRITYLTILHFLQRNQDINVDTQKSRELTVPVAGMNHMEDPRTLLAREYTLLLYMKSLWWMECMRQFHFTAESVVL